MQEMRHFFGRSGKKYHKTLIFYICLIWAVLCNLNGNFGVFPVVLTAQIVFSVNLFSDMGIVAVVVKAVK